MDTRQKAAYLWAWKEAIHAHIPKPGYKKHIIVAVTDAMTIATDWGQRIYRSDAEIARRAGVSRPTVIKYRQYLDEQGFYRFTGERKGETQSIRVRAIVIPGRVEPVPQAPNAAQAPACRECHLVMDAIQDSLHGDLWVCPANMQHTLPRQAVK